MRIALCFYGLVGSINAKGGESTPLDPNIAYEYYKKHIFDVNESIDIFIHTWSIDFEQQLTELYKPKKAIFQKQIEFDIPKNKNYTKKSIKSKIKRMVLKYINPKKYQQIIEDNRKSCFRSYSRWYSSKSVLDLKAQYEKEQNFTYDAVMVTRLDIGFFKDLVFKDYDMNYFYASNRNTPPWKSKDGKANYNTYGMEKEFFDLWFFSNSANMDIFSKVYDNLDEYEEISPHISSRTHVDKFIGKDKIKYIFYRWFDHELIRRKFFESHV